MSLFSDVTDFLHRTYATADDAVADLVPNLPAFFTAVDGSIQSAVSVVRGFYEVASLTAEFGPIVPFTLLAAWSLRTTPGQAQQGFSLTPFLTEGSDMSTLVIPDAFQITIHGLAGGRAVDNVFGVVNATGSAAGAATAAGTAWATDIMSNLTSSYTFVDVEAVDISSASGAIAVIPHNLPGQLSGSIATRAASALFQWGGGTRSRSGRGRTYVGPLMESQIAADGASLETATLSAMGTGAAAFLADLASSGYPFAVLSRKLSVATLITAGGVEPVIATQRRRIRS